MQNLNDMDSLSVDHSATKEVLQAAREQAVQVKDTMAIEATRALDSVKSAAFEQVEIQKADLAHSLRSVNEALLRTTQEMDNPTLAPQMERVADAVASAGKFIENHSIEEVGPALRRLSLQSPVLFYSGIFALGFAAGRFFSSTEHRPIEEPDVELPDYDINLLDEDLTPQSASLEQQTLTPPMVSHHGSY